MRNLLTLTVLSIFLAACSDTSGPDAIPPDFQLPSTLNAVAGEEFTYQIDVSDPQNLDVDLLFEGLPAWLEYLPATKTLQGTPAESDAGRTQLTITAENSVTGRSLTTRLRVFTSARELSLQENLEDFRSSITPGLLGVSVAVVDSDGRLYRAYTGNMGTSGGFPEYEATSMFRVASVTKPMTAALILKLVQDGLISRNDFFAEHYETPLPNADRMSIHHMLTHTAGIFDHLNSNNFWGHPTFTGSKVWTVDEIINFAVMNGSRFTPGMAYGYSNTGFCALGGLIETITDMPIREAFDQMLFNPLGLENSVYDDFSNPSNTIPDLAFNSRSYEYHLTAACAAGAVAASPADVAKFGWNLYGGRLLNEELTNALDINYGAALGGQNYGYGTRIWTIGGIRHYGHTGNLMDYRNILMYVPSLDISIAVHTHQPHASWSALTNSIFNYVVTQFSDQPAKMLPLEMWINESRDDEEQYTIPF